MIRSNPKYESISLASNKNWTLCCQKFQNIRLTHIVPNDAKFHEENRDTTFISSSFAESFVKCPKSAENKAFLRRNCKLTPNFVQSQPQMNK